MLKLIHDQITIQKLAEIDVYVVKDMLVSNGLLFFFYLGKENATEVELCQLVVLIADVVYRKLDYLLHFQIHFLIVHRVIDLVLLIIVEELNDQI